MRSLEQIQPVLASVPGRSNNLSPHLTLFANTPVSEKTNNLYDFAVKILILGDKGVGKTSLLHRFVHETEYKPEKQDITDSLHRSNSDIIDVKFKPLCIDHKRIQIEMWDLLSPPNSNDISKQSLLNSYIGSAMAIFIVFDINNRASFDNVQSKWLPLIEHSCNIHDDKLTKVIIANKTDLLSPDNLLPPDIESKRDSTASDTIVISKMETSSRSRGDVGSDSSINYEFVANELKCKYFKVSCHRDSDLDRMKEILSDVVMRVYNAHHTESEIALSFMTPPKELSATPQCDPPPTAASYTLTLENEPNTHSNSMNYMEFDFNLKRQRQKKLNHEHEQMLDANTSRKSTRNIVADDDEKQEEEEGDHDLSDAQSQRPPKTSAETRNRHDSPIPATIFECVPTSRPLPDSYELLQQADAAKASIDIDIEMDDTLLYSLNGLSAYHVSISYKMLLQMFAMTFFYPITMLYQFWLFYHQNDAKEMTAKSNRYLPAEFDVCNDRMRMFHDILDPFLRSGYFDESMFCMEMSYDTNDFLIQTAKQLFYRFVCISNGFLLYLLMSLSVIWYSLHYGYTQLHFMECVGPFFLFTLTALITAVWVAVDFNVEAMDKSGVAVLPLHLNYNKQDAKTFTNTTISQFVAFNFKQTKYQERIHPRAWYMHSWMEMASFVLPFVYSLLPSFIRLCRDESFVAVHDEGFWVIGLITNYATSFVFIRVCLVTFNKSFEGVMYLNHLITSIIVRKNPIMLDGPDNKLPFLSLMKTINTSSWLQLRNYCHYHVVHRMKDIEVFAICNIVICVVASALMIVCKMDDIDAALCGFWISIGFIGLCVLFRIGYKIEKYDSAQIQELLAQRLFINDCVHVMNAKKKNVSDFQSVFDSIQFLILYVEKHSMAPTIFEVRLHRILCVLMLVVFACFALTFVIFPVSFIH